MLKFIGIGNAFNNYFNNTAAYFMDDDDIVFIDAGVGLLDFIIRNYEKDAEKFSKFRTPTFLITHTHPDHISDLASAIFYLYMVVGTGPIQIMGPMRELDKYLSLSGVPENMFVLRGLGRLQGKTYTAQKVVTDHVEHLISYGYLITFNEGSGFYYSGDTNKINENLVEYLKTGLISKVYHEVTPYEHDPAHTYYGKLLKVFSKEFRENVVLMHIDRKSEVLNYIMDGFSVAEEVSGL